MRHREQTHASSGAVATGAAAAGAASLGAMLLGAVALVGSPAPDLVAAEEEATAHDPPWDDEHYEVAVREALRRGERSYVARRGVLLDAGSSELSVMIGTDLADPLNAPARSLLVRLGRVPEPTEPPTPPSVALAEREWDRITELHQRHYLFEHVANRTMVDPDWPRRAGVWAATLLGVLLGVAGLVGLWLRPGRPVRIAATPRGLVFDDLTIPRDEVVSLTAQDGRLWVRRRSAPPRRSRRVHALDEGLLEPFVASWHAEARRPAPAPVEGSVTDVPEALAQLIQPEARAPRRDRRADRPLDRAPGARRAPVGEGCAGPSADGS